MATSFHWFATPETLHAVLDSAASVHALFGGISFLQVTHRAGMEIPNQWFDTPIHWNPVDQPLWSAKDTCLTLAQCAEDGRPQSAGWVMFMEPNVILHGYEFIPKEEPEPGVGLFNYKPLGLYHADCLRRAAARKGTFLQRFEGEPGFLLHPAPKELEEGKIALA